MTYDTADIFTDTDRPVGTWISIGHPAVAEVTANLGLDFLLIDTEHTPLDLQTVENMIRAVEATDSQTKVIVRVPDNDHVRLKRLLDLGVETVMVPMLETKEDAMELVDAVRYPPEGSRGVASGRAAGYGQDFQEYVEHANKRINTIAQIETVAGVDNVDEIASVDGVDALFVGPADLSASLDVFADSESDRFQEAVEKIIDAAHNADLPVGTLSVDHDGINRCVKQGFDFLIVGKDTASLARSTIEAKERFNRAIEQRTTPE